MKGEVLDALEVLEGEAGRRPNGEAIGIRHAIAVIRGVILSDDIRNPHPERNAVVNKEVLRNARWCAGLIADHAMYGPTSVNVAVDVKEAIDAILDPD